MKNKVLLTCFNRSEKTLNCINQLCKIFSQKDIFVIDDASTDGTYELINSKFPEVQLFKSKGNLYWAGGMRYGYEKIKSLEFDHLYLVNDDICLKKNWYSSIKNDLSSIANKTEDFILSGCFEDRKGNLSYGGVKKSSILHPLRFKQVAPNGSIQNVDTINMNFTVVPKRTIDNIGFFKNYFIHGGADFEYGLRALKNGTNVFISSKIIGICDRNSDTGTSKDKSLGIFDRLEKFNSIKEQPFKQRIKFFQEHGGPLWFLYFPLPYIRIVFNL